jgi:hypothetical protein
LEEFEFLRDRGLFWVAFLLDFEGWILLDFKGKRKITWFKCFESLKIFLYAIKKTSKNFLLDL